MKKLRLPALPPVARLTLALTGVTLALVLTAQALRLLPDAQSEALAHRKRTVESLTVQLSSPVMLERVDAMQEVLDTMVERNPEVRSAGLRTIDGALLISAGDHAQRWNAPPKGKSTAENVQVPIFASGEEVGALEVHFMPLTSPWSFAAGPGAVPWLLLYLAVAGLFFYGLVLRRSLKALDPSAVIPDRVRLAMDTLVEGVIIMDEDQSILLANRAIGSVLGVPADDLLGRSAEVLNWRSPETGGAPPQLPWQRAMASGQAVADELLELRAADGTVRCFNVNASPVLDPRGKVRGALASFDDITDLQQQNEQLQRAMAELEESRKAVEKHNVELRYLAMRDALTGCLNRRALFEALEKLVSETLTGGRPLWCAMIDIDHFKQVNDRFGHATGDRVIAYVAETIRLSVGSADLVGRYGGEEFCVVFPGRTAEEVAAILEKIRTAVIAGAASRFTRALRPTVSSGYAALPPDELHGGPMIDRADQALYAAKNSGRNRVVAWSEQLGGDVAAETGLHRRQKGELTGTWRSRSRSDGRETGLFAIPQGGAMDTFRERVAQSLALAARHGWTAALLRVEVVTVDPAAANVAVILQERIAGLLRRSDILSLILGERVVAGNAEALPSVSRLGPGEIGVLLLDVTDINAIGRVVQRVVKVIAEPVAVEGREVLASCAIGISVAPSDAEDVDALLNCAEQALRAVRARRGGERYAFYQASMTETLARTMRIESGLRRALAQNALQIVYQPQIALDNGRVNGFEALLRWTDAEGQAIPPDQFIPVAESTGLIEAIGDWVLHRACVQARAWHRTTGLERRVAVNISAVQVMSPGFAERVAGILQATGVDPRLVELEITETAFMSDLETAARTLRYLRRLGLHIALDDFGTGYSSLSYLKQLPIDSVKIDSRFVRDLNDSREGLALVNAIVGMAHGLGIRVVAEGVETPDVLALLRRLGCDAAQGYLISRPVPVPEALAMAGDEAAAQRHVALSAGSEAQVEPPRVANG